MSADRVTPPATEQQPSPEAFSPSRPSAQPERRRTWSRWLWPWRRKYQRQPAMAESMEQTERVDRESAQEHLGQGQQEVRGAQDQEEDPPFTPTFRPRRRLPRPSQLHGRECTCVWCQIDGRTHVSQDPETGLTMIQSEATSWLRTYEAMERLEIQYAALCNMCAARERAHTTAVHQHGARGMPAADWRLGQASKRHDRRTTCTTCTTAYGHQRGGRVIRAHERMR